VYVDLTAAYDTIWHCGLTCKLLQFLPGRHMVRMLMEMIGNRSFTLTTGNGKRSRLRRLKNGVPQGSVLVPLLFNTYISDLPTVEFALQSQHEAFSDSGMQLISNINDLKNKLRKRPRRLSFVSMHGSDWEEYWENNVLQRNELSPKYIKIEHCEDWDIRFNLSGYHGLSTVEPLCTLCFICIY